MTVCDRALIRKGTRGELNYLELTRCYVSSIRVLVAFNDGCNDDGNNGKSNTSICNNALTVLIKSIIPTHITNRHREKSNSFIKCVSSSATASRSSITEVTAKTRNQNKQQH